VPGHYVRRVWQYDPTLYAAPRYRRACSYEPFIPDVLAELEVAVSGAISGLVSDAERAIADLNRSAAPQLAPLARLLLRTESIASSKVEGMQVDARSLARAEAQQDAGQRIGPTATEVLANIDAMQFAIERVAGEPAITVDHLCDIHSALMEHDPLTTKPGQIRTVQNWIGGNDYNPCEADFVPPPPEEVDRLLLDLCAFTNNDELSPLVQAAIAHAQFETIHPFEDGNGRTGRALVQVILRKRGLAGSFVPISVMLARNKDRYIAGLTSFHGETISEWIGTFAESTAAAARLAERYLDRVRRLQEEWRARLAATASPRADAAVWALIDVLPAHPVITTAVGTTATGRTRPAVANGIAQLVACNVLTAMGTASRNRAWESTELLDLIVGLEAGESIRP
jgi:Fic family protein